MNKILFVVSVMVLLTTIALVALAAEVECEEGLHWEGETGYYEDGECSSWSDTECIDYEMQCTNWFFGWCLNWDNVCVEMSEPECTEYDQVWIEGEGACVLDEVEPTPVVKEIKGSSAGLFHILPRIDWIRSNDRIIDWLATHFTIGKVICSTESHPFAINMYGQPFNGTPNSLDLGENYGYEILINGEDGFWTYHRFEMPDWMFGTYYCRTISQTLIDTLTGNELVSQEIQIEL